MPGSGEACCLQLVGHHPGGKNETGWGIVHGLLPDSERVPNLCGVSLESWRRMRVS